MMRTLIRSADSLSFVEAFPMLLQYSNIIGRISDLKINFREEELIWVLYLFLCLFNSFRSSTENAQLISFRGSRSFGRFTVMSIGVRRMHWKVESRMVLFLRYF
jgi:hypothetical protein